jgi:hypothetical protein
MTCHAEPSAHKGQNAVIIILDALESFLELFMSFFLIYLSEDFLELK